MTAAAPLRPEPVPLSQDRHGARRWRGPQDYTFARQLRMVPVVLAELEIVATALPIVFADSPRGDFPQPVALLRLQAKDSPFVTPEGRWLAPYIPALLRVHPFTARQISQDTRMELLVDESSGLITDDVGDNRFFDPFGAPSDALQAVIAFFRQYENSARDTRRACKALAELRDASGKGLFKPLDFKGFQSQGLSVLDRAVFDDLDEGRFLDLRRAGALHLASAHFIGCHQLDWLKRAEAAFERSAGVYNPSAVSGQVATPASSEVTDFLSALALAHSDDQLGHGPEDVTFNEHDP